jgi:RNA polymerase sigma-70 factor, ECF subfamily
MLERYLQLASDQALIQKAQCGGRNEFNELVHRYRRAVVLVAYDILGSRSIAEEIAQEVFVVAFHSLRRLRNPAKFSSWLYAIARFRSRRAAAYESRTIAIDPADMQALADIRTASNHTAHDDDQYAELSGAIDEMQPDCRTVILLRYGEQWRIARIADFLSIPTTTVNWRLHQARKILREKLIKGEENNND